MVLCSSLEPLAERDRQRVHIADGIYHDVVLCDEAKALLLANSRRINRMVIHFSGSTYGIQCIVVPGCNDISGLV